MDEPPAMDVDWRAFCRRYLRDLLAVADGVCGRLGLSRDDAEEIVQDAILDTMPRVIRGPDERCVAAYVRQAIRNKATDRVRSAGHRLRELPGGETDEGAPWLEVLASRFGGLHEPTDIDGLHEVRAVLEARDFLHLFVEGNRDLARRQVESLFAIRVEQRAVHDHARATCATDSQVKKWAERGSYLVAGWVDARCGGHPFDPAWLPARAACWRRGRTAGDRYQQAPILRRPSDA